MALDRILDGLDLTAVHQTLAIAGALLSVFVMQLARYESDAADAPRFVMLFRRLSLMVLALGFLWSLSYSDDRGWQPWPPTLVIMAAVVMVLMVRAISIWTRVRRSGHCIVAHPGDRIAAGARAARRLDAVRRFR